ncbi:hypothetical protein BDY24DRAFT_385264 [Mrakia frigida]|uniref:uncharacterized protein n=1 Tax=Mrakia frigida TaxID=29902 RepID=UPI003FCC0FEC
MGYPILSSFSSSDPFWSKPTHKTPLNPFIAILPHLFLFLALALPPRPVRLPLRFLFFPAIMVSQNWIMNHYTTGLPVADYGVNSFAVTMMFKAGDLLGEHMLGPEQKFFKGPPGPVPSFLTSLMENEDGSMPVSRVPMGAWERVKWAVGLMTSMRGVGWNWQVRNVPPASQQPRKVFVFTQSAKFCLLYIGMDLLSNFMQSHPYFTSRASIPPSSFLDAILIRVSALLAGYGALNTQYTLLSVVGVAIGWGEVKDWRPLFGFGGLWRGGGSVGRFWSEIWHQSYQRSLTAMASGISTKLLPSIFIPFFFSAILHHAGTAALIGPEASFLYSPTVHFFLLQPFAIVFERFVLFKFLDRRSPLLWVWTAAWILGSGGLICSENVRGGLWTVEAVPFSVVRWVARRF